MSLFSNNISPLSGVINFKMQLAKVDFPHPDSPTRETISPFSIENDMSLTASTYT